ncbi:MAG: hypothetical protein ABII02_01565 [Candidatus Magasanikbacteria bacterium]
MPPDRAMGHTERPVTIEEVDRTETRPEDGVHQMDLTLWRDRCRNSCDG